MHRPLRLWRAALVSALIAVPGAALGDFLDTTWTVTGFAGEAWFAEPETIIGQTQTFERGYAEGVFYQCDFGGQSSTYTAYATEDFLANPEFALFAPLAEALAADGTRIFVHRVSCNGGGDPALRRVLYPFVTSESRQAAWVLFEGGVYTLAAP